MVFTCQYNVGQEVELVTLVEVEKSDSLEDGKSFEVDLGDSRDEHR